MPILMWNTSFGVLKGNTQTFLFSQLLQSLIITLIIALDIFHCSIIFCFEVFYENQQFCVLVTFIIKKETPYIISAIIYY